MQAVIDLGSNTFNLLIGDAKQGSAGIVLSLEQPVGLGRGGIQNNLITPEAEERAMRVLAGFEQYLLAHHVSRVLAMATSAIRNAENGPAFIQKIKERFGYAIQTISGELEAGLIFEGAKRAFPNSHETFLVMDIGGGSVEFILGKGETVLWKRSYELGAIRLQEKFAPSNPMQADEIFQINKWIDTMLSAGEDSLYAQLEMHKPITLAGTAGSFESLKDVLEKDFGQKSLHKSEHSRSFGLNHWSLFLNRVVFASLEERQQLANLVDFRRELIGVAGLLIDRLIQKSETDRIICLDFALKEGVFFSLMPDFQG